MSEQTAYPQSVNFPGLGLEETVTLVRALQDRHGATVIGHDVKPDGTITFDLRLNACAIRSMRYEYLMALTNRHLAYVTMCRQWTDQVRARIASLRSATNAIAGRG